MLNFDTNPKEIPLLIFHCEDTSSIYELLVNNVITIKANKKNTTRLHYINKKQENKIMACKYRRRRAAIQYRERYHHKKRTPLNLNFFCSDQKNLEQKNNMAPVEQNGEHPVCNAFIYECARSCCFGFGRSGTPNKWVANY